MVCSENVDGEANVVADVMKRWMRGYRGKLCAIKRVKYRLLENTAISSPESEYFEWLNVGQIREIQHKYDSSKPSEVT